MLVIVSDLHLGDGTCAKTVSPDAFYIFRDRLHLLLQTASIRKDDKYRPIEEVDLLLLGDIFELNHSTLWLEEEPGQPGYVRPWSNPAAPELGQKILQITRAILQNNAKSIEVLKKMSQGEALRLPPVDSRGRPAWDAGEQIPVRVRIHYMIGNHDWLYCLPGPLYDQARQELIDAVGLANAPTPFPFTVDESPLLADLLAEYRVFARHGDYFDKFNFNQQKGRAAATLGDAMGIELLNRFPLEVERRMGNELPKTFYRMLAEITNIRPSLAVPLWIGGQLQQYSGNPRKKAHVKAIWDELAEAFLQNDFVRSHDRKTNPFDSVDGLEALVRFTRHASFESINRLIIWMQERMWSDDISLSRHAVREKAFRERWADFIVYGHTHHHEVIPLDVYSRDRQHHVSQMLFNSGTWRVYHDLARFRPEAQKFVPYQVMTYLTFYKEDERRGRRYEVWSGRLM